MAYRDPTKQQQAQRRWYLANKPEHALRSKRTKLRAAGRMQEANRLDRKIKALVAQRQAQQEGSTQQWELQQVERAFAQWQKTHIRRCEDFAGPCCSGCHEDDNLILLDLDNSDVAYICCLKRIENKLCMSDAYESLLVQRYRNLHAVAPKWKPSHDAVAKLPP